MEALAWLDECLFEREMYMDLPRGMVRYCFRPRQTRQHLLCGLHMQRKGEPSLASFDSERAHQVGIATRLDACDGNATLLKNLRPRNKSLPNLRSPRKRDLG
jgi:hypothetical protein